MPTILELFCGTGSISEAFRAEGWDTYTVDINPDAGAENISWVGDIRDFNYQDASLPMFDVIWASPPCTQYSCARTVARTPRDLEGADELVNLALDIISYSLTRNPRLLWFVENPQSGLLKSREIMQLLPYRDLDYCASGGTPYRKRTRIWSNAAADPKWRSALCLGPGVCASMQGKKHIACAQRLQTVDGITSRNFGVNELYRIPDRVCREVARYCNAHWLQHDR